MATNDLLSLAEAKAALRISTNDLLSDDLLASAVTAISLRLDLAIGPTITRLITDERHSGGRDTLELRYFPVQAVGSVVEYQAGSAVTLTEKGVAINPSEGWFGERYHPDPSLYSGVIVRTVDDYRQRFWSGVGNVVCSYTAGRTSTTAQVDSRIKEGAKLALRNWWRQYEQSTGGFDEFEVPRNNFPTFALPQACCQLLHDLWQQETGFGAPF